MVFLVLWFSKFQGLENSKRLKTFYITKLYTLFWLQNCLVKCLEVWKTSVSLQSKTIVKHYKTQINMKTNYIFSKCKKLQGVLSEIYSDLLEISDTEEQSRNEVKRYCKEFRRESDCNIVQYGNMLIYYDDVREFYRKHGYKMAERLSDSALWEIYCRQAGYVARLIAGDRL